MRRDLDWMDEAWQSGPWRRWLTDHGSLTLRLQRRCGDLRVLRLRQELARPHRDERRTLGLRTGQLALIREVLLLCGDDVLVFAHSVIPQRGLRGAWRSLSKLGNKPLGAALFANPRIQRHPLSSRRLDRRHPLYRRLARHLGELPSQLWARRSRFVQAGQPILVTEVFLPRVLSLPATPLAKHGDPGAHMPTR
jgi:chorismate--pyruvate lyase